MLVEGKGPSDQMDQAAALVRACVLPHVTGWDYRVEDPRSGPPGLPREAAGRGSGGTRCYTAFPARSAPMANLRSDRVLINAGARLLQ